MRVFIGAFVAAAVVPACVVDTLSNEEFDNTIAAYSRAPARGKAVAELTPTGRTKAKIEGIAFMRKTSQSDRLVFTARLSGLEPGKTYQWDVHSNADCGNRGGAAGPQLTIGGRKAKLPQLRADEDGVARVRRAMLHSSFQLSALTDTAIIVHGESRKNTKGNGDEGGETSKGERSDNGGGGEGTGGGNGSGAGDGGGGGARLACGLIRTKIRVR